MTHVSTPSPRTPPPVHTCLPQKAASSVLAACASSSSSRGSMGKSRRRIRSLPDSGRFTPDNGGSGGGGSGTSRGSASSASSRAGASRGRNRGGSSFTLRGGLAGGPPSTAGAPESAPRSGSSLVDAPPDGGGGDMVTAGVVKRGGNLRWISPPNPTTSSGGVSEVNRVQTRCFSIDSTGKWYVDRPPMQLSRGRFSYPLDQPPPPCVVTRRALHTGKLERVGKSPFKLFSTDESWPAVSLRARR